MRLLLILVLVPLLLAGCGGGAAKPAPPRFDSYLALGDSYTAGLGIAPVAYFGCGRSSSNYPQLIATALRLSTVTDASCSASTTRHLISAQRTPLGTVEPPQGAHLRAGTDLVTIGWGLNNGGLSFFVVNACVPPPVGRPADCRDFLSRNPAEIHAQVGRAVEDVAGVLRAVRTKAPKAEIVLVGYPSLGRETCPPWPVPADFPARADLVMAAFDEAFANLARREGARYVDVYGASRGHGICSAEPWVLGHTADPGKGARLHPLPAYHAAVAELVAAALED